MMFSLSSDDIYSAVKVAYDRERQLKNDHAKIHEETILKEISDVLTSGDISKRLRDVCSEHTNPKDLRIAIFGYNPKAIISSASGVKLTRGDLINNKSVLYRVSKMFNENVEPLDRFRITISTSIRRNSRWSVMWLNFYPFGVPKWLVQEDPDMPHLESGHEEHLPASPIPMMNPEDDVCPCECGDKNICFNNNHCDCTNYRDDESVHDNGCCCRDCRQRKW
jgi:hypothetical protein